MLSSLPHQQPVTGRGPRFKLLHRVMLNQDFLSEGYIVPEGAQGTVVIEHGDGEAYEVEFTSPFHAVVGVPSSLLSPAP